MYNIPIEEKPTYSSMIKDYRLKRLYYSSYCKNQYSYPKFSSQRIRKRDNKTLGTCVINSPMSPPSLPNLDFRQLFISCLIMGRKKNNILF